jgi:hypothetical protein
MPKRFFIVLLLALYPLTAAADDTPAPDATPAATETPAATPSTTPDPAASGLGPSTTGGSSASTGDGSALQPAGGSPLQSTTGDSTGLTAPNANTLQAPTTPGETLRVLAGEADGGPHTLDDTDANGWRWLWWVLGLGLLAAGGWLLRRSTWIRPVYSTLRHQLSRITRR